MADIDIRAFWEGIAASSTGNILISKLGKIATVSNVNFTGSGYKGTVTFSDGTIIHMTKVEEKDGKITKMFLKKDADDTEYYVDCYYDPDEPNKLRKVGLIYVHNIEKLQLSDEYNLQTKDITLNFQNETVNEIEADDGYIGLSKARILRDTNLLPENIKAGVTIFGITGTYNG